MGKNSLLIDNGLDRNSPLIYKIMVTNIRTGEVKPIYVGKSDRGSSRPFTRYDANIRRKLAGLPPLNGKMYRPIHCDLEAACGAGHRIGIELIKNVLGTSKDVLSEEHAYQDRLELKGEARRLSDSGEFL